VSQEGSYRLVGTGDISRGYAIALGIALTGLALGTLLPLPHPRPWEQHLIAFGTVTLFGLAFETWLVLHRRRTLSARLVLDATGLSLKEGTRVRWHIAWPNLDSVVLRSYCHHYFSQALKCTNKSGKVRLVPTGSIIYGKMPDLDNLLAQLDALGYPVRDERRG